VRRRVLRRAKKLEEEAKDNPVLLAAPVEEVEAPLRQDPSSSDTGALSSITGNNSQDGSTTTEGLDDVRRTLNLASNASAESGSSKKSRRSSRAVQQDEALICKKRKIESRGMKAATTRIHQNHMLSPSNPAKKSHAAIVREVNESFGPNVNAKTAARMVKEGRIGVSPLKRGPVGNFPKNIWVAMKKVRVQSNGLSKIIHRE
jgi:hypothetical protein